MKEYIIQYFMKKQMMHIRSLDYDKREKIRYGLEGIYLTISKIIFILFFWIIFQIPFEGFFFLILFFLIRFFAFGAHAKSSSMCLLFSSILLIGGPLLAKHVILHVGIKIILSSVSLLLLSRFAPVDSKKWDLLLPKRKKLNGYSIFIGSMFTVFSIFIQNHWISNSFCLTLFFESLLVTPLAYRFLKVPYPFSSWKEVN